jgi:hypothetical protein
MKLQEVYDSEGVSGILQRIKSRVYREAFTYRIELEQAKMDSDCDDKELIELNIKLLDQIYADYRCEITPRKYEILKERLQTSLSDRGFVVVDKDNTVYGYYHFSFKSNFDTCVNYLVPDEAFNIHLFDDYTFENRRGNRAHTFSITARLRLAKELGYKTATVNIQGKNQYSERAYQNIGFIKQQEIQYYKLWIIKKTRVRELLR